MALDWIMDGVKSAKDYFTDDKDDIIGYSTEYGKVESTGLSVEDAAKDIEEMANSVGTEVVNEIEDVVESVTFNPEIPKIPSTSPIVPVKTEAEQAANKESGGLPIPNPLNVYASYNYIVTIACLTNDEVNNPWTTYRVSTPSNIVLRSGGWGNTPGLVSTSEWDSKLEYFIDNLTMKSLIAPSELVKHTNATEIEFQVTEPYGVGTFIESLMKTAQNAGHSNHLSAPFLMIIDFIGWDDNGKSVNHIDTGLRRTIPFRFSNITFNVTEAGSTYSVSAYPWNEQSTLNHVFSLKENRKIRGRTVKECCQTGFYAVSSAFNNREQKKRIQDPSYVPDEYLIIFPKEEDEVDLIEKIQLGSSNSTETKFDFEGDSINAAGTGKRAISGEEEFRLWGTVASAIVKDENFRAELEANESIIILRSNEGEKARTYADNMNNNNKIGSAKIVENPQDQVKHPMATPMFAELKNTRDGIFDRNKIKISDDIAEFNFKTGTTVEDMIEEIILMSEYGRTLLEAEPDADGMIKWFKIETYLIAITNKNKQKTEGRDAYVYIYAVVPYKTHKSRFTPVTNIIDVTSLENQCIKQYDYIYTGQNDSILNFDIAINSGFFVAVNATHTGKHGTKTKKSDSRGRQAPSQEIVQTPGQGTPSANGHRATQAVDKNTTSRQGGGHHENEKTVAARNFNDTYLSSGVDLINVTMTIMGDPYYLNDSGTGNYRAKPGEYINISKDGTMYIHNGEVDVKVNFKTPIDYGYEPGKGDKEGHLKFEDALSTTSYSGVYQLIEVHNKFAQGIFTQDLVMVRRPMQKGTDSKEGAAKEDKLVTTGGSRKKFNDDIYAAKYGGGYAAYAQGGGGM